MRRNVQQMTDAELREHLNKLANTPGKAAAKAYRVALDEAIQREKL